MDPFVDRRESAPGAPAGADVTMSWLRGVLQKTRETFSRRRVDEELDEEIQFHLEREVERLIAKGMDSEAARSLANRTFGGVGRVKERAREEYGFRLLDQAVRDVRHAARGLRRSPSFAIAAVLTLGLGIGATTAIYSIVDAVVLEPLPYPESDRLVRIFQQNSPTNRWSISVADFQAVEAQQKVFESVAALRGGTATLTGSGRPERISALFATSEWFRTIGVEPTEGRGFLPGEDRPGAERVVVLSDAFRERAFGPGAAVLGQTITLDGHPHVIVGVLPPGRGSLAGYPADVWPILQLHPPTRRGPFFLRGFGRLLPEASFEDARTDLDAVSERIFPIWAAGFSDENARLTPVLLRDVIVSDVGGALFLLLGAVAGVLLIGIANVANLLLARAGGRTREMALRASLGATRTRLVRQLLAENLLLAALGGAAGVAIAFIGLETLVATSPGLPRLEEVSLDPGVLGFAAAVTLTTGLLFGLAPLLHGVSRDVAVGLRAAGRTATAGVRWRRVRSALVTAEFALALPLLIGASLLLGSFLRLRHVDPGYDPHDLISAQLSLPASDYAGAVETMRFWNEALRRIEAIPGVASAGISTALPPDNSGDTNNFDLLDKPVASGASQHVVPWSWISPGYLRTLQVPLLEGRLLDERDRGTPAVVVVSRSWADRYYPDEEVLGKQLYAGGDTGTPMTVIGVVGDVKLTGLSSSDDPAVYEPFAQAGFRTVNLLVRARGSASGILRQVGAGIESLDAELPLANVETMTERLSTAVSGPRYWTTLLGVFAGVGLLLAAIGIYGVLSYHVTRQTRDIGIRITLGADPAAVRRLVLRQGMSRAALGIGIGLVGSLLLTRLLENLLFGVSPTDPLTFATVTLVLTAVALGSCFVPARRATRVDPIRTLNAE